MPHLRQGWRVHPSGPGHPLQRHRGSLRHGGLRALPGPPLAAHRTGHDPLRPVRPLCPDLRRAAGPRGAGVSAPGATRWSWGPTGRALDCDFCGLCVSTCPVGASTTSSSRRDRVWKLRRSLPSAPTAAGLRGGLPPRGGAAAASDAGRPDGQREGPLREGAVRLAGLPESLPHRGAPDPAGRGPARGRLERGHRSCREGARCRPALARRGVGRPAHGGPPHHGGGRGLGRLLARHLRRRPGRLHPGGRVPPNPRNPGRRPGRAGCGGDAPGSGRGGRTCRAGRRLRRTAPRAQTPRQRLVEKRGTGTRRCLVLA
ncbi:MAG: 4Fe-4S binding protein [Syntrophaceae bacterium]|nr:4Fe-4S binding protein [Syntrophaceae bacterium]